MYSDEARNRRWKSLVDLVEMVREERVDLDELASQIQKKKSDERGVHYGPRIAANERGEIKPSPKITFLDSKEGLNSNCRARVSKRSREEEGPTLKSKKISRMVNVLPNLDLGIGPNRHLCVEEIQDPVKLRFMRNREDEEEEKSEKRRKILLLHHRLILGRDGTIGADEDRTWRKSIRKFVPKTNSGKFGVQDYAVRNYAEGETSKSCPRVRFVNSRRPLDPPPIPIPIPVGEGFSERMRRRVVECGGCLESVVLVIEKKLFQTDVDIKQCRLSIPHTQIKKPFLNSLYPHEASRLESTAQGIPVALLLEDHEQRMSLRNWKSNKIYALVGGWIQACSRTGLEAGKSIQLWGFRRRNFELSLIFNQLP